MITPMPIIARSPAQGEHRHLQRVATSAAHPAPATPAYKWLRRLLSFCALAALIAGAAGGPPRAAAGTAEAIISLDQALSSSPMVLDERTGHLFVATIAHTEPSWVSMIDVRSGKLLRHTPVGLGSPLLAFDPPIDRVYAAGLVTLPPIGRPPFPRILPPPTQLLVALDGATGQVVGTARLGSQGHGIGVDMSLGHLFVAGGGGGSCTHRTCTTEPSIVTMLDARTLNVLAVTPMNSPLDDLLVDSRNGRVYLSTIDGVEVLDARTARHVLRIPLSASMLAADEPANRVFLADGSGDLLLLDGHTSQVLTIQHTPLPFPFSFGFPGPTMAVDSQTGHVYYAAAGASARRGAPPGSVRLYEADGATGHVIRSCPIAVHPSAVAAAARSGIAITTDFGTNTAMVIRMAGCAVLQSVRVAPVPSNIAIDAANYAMVIESNTPQRPASASGGDPTSHHTTVTIAALPR